MSSLATQRTRRCNQQTIRGRRAKAVGFWESACDLEELADGPDDRPDSYVSLCVLAGIAAADVICCRSARRARRRRQPQRRHRTTGEGRPRSVEAPEDLARPQDEVRLPRYQLESCRPEGGGPCGASPRRSGSGLLRGRDGDTWERCCRSSGVVSHTKAVWPRSKAAARLSQKMWPTMSRRASAMAFRRTSTLAVHPLLVGLLAAGTKDLLVAEFVDRCQLFALVPLGLRRLEGHGRGSCCVQQSGELGDHLGVHLVVHIEHHADGSPRGGPDPLPETPPLHGTHTLIASAPVSGSGGWAQTDGEPGAPAARTVPRPNTPPPGFAVPPTQTPAPPPPPPPPPAPAPGHPTPPAPLLTPWSSGPAPTIGPSFSGQGPTTPVTSPWAPAAGRGGGKKTGLAVAVFALGLLVIGGIAFAFGIWLGPSGSEHMSNDDEAPVEGNSAPTDGPASTTVTAEPPVDPPTPVESAEGNEDALPPEQPIPTTVDLSGNPIVDGWFVLVSSARKGTTAAGSLQGVAANSNGHLVDTDSYQTGFASDGRAGTLDEKAGSDPNYWPGSDALAAVVGPFSDRRSAEASCRSRGLALGVCVRQFRPLPTAGH